MVERVRRTLKAAILSRRQEWLRALPVEFLGIRAMPNESGFSPFTAVTGTQVLFPWHAVQSDGVPVGQKFIRYLARHMSIRFCYIIKRSSAYCFTSCVRTKGFVSVLACLGVS